LLLEVLLLLVVLPLLLLVVLPLLLLMVLLLCEGVAVPSSTCEAGCKLA
jgi:hypothetical protein